MAPGCITDCIQHRATVVTIQFSTSFAVFWLPKVNDINILSHIFTTATRESICDPNEDNIVTTL